MGETWGVPSSAPLPVTPGVGTLEPLGLLSFFQQTFADAYRADALLNSGGAKIQSHSLP